VSSAGVKSRLSWRVMYLNILLVVPFALSSCAPSASASAATTNNSDSPETGPVIVKIMNMNPAVKTAVARVLETREADTLDQNKLSFSACLDGQHISVWAPGYYISNILCNGRSPVEYQMQLEPLNAADDPNYRWIDSDIRSNPTLNCDGCHSNPSLGLNEYTEWNTDGHSKAFVTPYFWTTYLGVDINGNPGQQTRWGISGDGGKLRLPADPIQPDNGPGYQLDYPNESGNCAFCHAPAAIGATQQGTNLTSLISGSWGNRVNVATEGVACDVCHKVIDVSLDDHQLPYVERPGILSFSFVRPTPGLQFIAGPGAHLAISNPNVKRTCAPVFSESKFCAACHYGKFSGVEIYASYKEWLDSPYSQSNQNFRSCQDCHMPSPELIGNTLSSERGACSEPNQKFRDFSHNMMKYGADPDNNLRTIPLIVKEAATIAIDKIVLAGGQVTFGVTVVNSGAGHKFPTDSPLRHLILLVEVRDLNNNSLTQVGGPMIPKVGDSEYAGSAGQIYANLLKDKDTNSIPTIAYWNPVDPAWQNADTRLVPGVPVRSEYTFAAPSNGSFVVTARLIYRNAFSDIANKKKWPIMDIEAAKVSVPIVP
jgi:nitrate/TMAO reductase-like tetraheme cytochrome c subunit